MPLGYDYNGMMQFCKVCQKLGLNHHFCSMHDYSRDIMLANAQTDMEANLKKMQQNQMVIMQYIRIHCEKIFYIFTNQFNLTKKKYFAGCQD